MPQNGYECLHGMFREWKDSGKLEKATTLSEYAKATLDCNVSQIALAWCIKNPSVSTVLLGANKVDQIRDNLRSI